MQPDATPLDTFSEKYMFVYDLGVSKHFEAKKSYKKN